MARRQLGHGRGGRMKIEKDAAEVTAGVRHGRTLGGPIALQVRNRDYANWEDRMNPWPVEEEIAEVHLPRPGHADLVGVQKYKHSDVRNILERASRPRDGGPGRRRRRLQGVSERARRRGLLARRPDRLRRSSRERAEALTPADFAEVDASPVRCLDPEAAKAMVAEIDDLRRANESLGGVFEVQAFGLVPGPRLPRLLGGATRRAPRPGDLLDPGDQGRLDRRRVRCRGRARAPRRTTRSSTTASRATTARPTAPAAWRAG